ncbi:hypothetical protein [Streptomyces sp. ISID311]|uniref:hypothetical protein n=1 Tax=Streptomyces sp. ISID311 TaxID=2601673 RepID=UPI0011BD3412|nr:hypothetical protein [Streptomyces sp. ISID311]TXC99850.1 hypothetical protein FS847_00855 [Streptomyces sp. ISID311]
MQGRQSDSNPNDIGTGGTPFLKYLKLHSTGGAAEDPIPEVTNVTRADLARLRRSLRRMRALLPLHVLPSHGETTDPRLLDRDLDYFPKLADRVQALTPEQLVRLGQLGEAKPSEASQRLESIRLSFSEYAPVDRQLTGKARAFYDMCHRKAVRATALERLEVLNQG